MLSIRTFDLDEKIVYKMKKRVLEDGIRTIDIHSEGMTLVGCKQMGDEIVSRI